MRSAGFLSLLMIMGTAGCDNRATTPRPAEGRSEQPAAAASASLSPGAAPVVSLEGEWRVAGIDGRPLDEPYGIALSGNPKELWWEPRCAGIARSYRIDGAAIEFGPVELEGSPPAPGSPPPPVCAIPIPPRLSDVARALHSATTLQRTPDNAVLIAGGGHSLTLFSQ